MKKKYAILFLSFSLITLWVKASPGDTTKIIAFDKLSMNRYGNFDKWVKLPGNEKNTKGFG
jgi:hypothetical protein